MYSVYIQCSNKLRDSQLIGIEVKVTAYQNKAPIFVLPLKQIEINYFTREAPKQKYTFPPSQDPDGDNFKITVDTKDFPFVHFDA